MNTVQSTIPSPSLSYDFFQPLEEIVFFDIETTGLSPKASSLYLIGAMYYEETSKSWRMIQWFADDYNSEASILAAFFDFLEPFHVLYHFNGTTFDIPYVLEKCKKHNLPLPEHVKELFENRSHHCRLWDGEAFFVDILKEVKPFQKRLGLAHAKQTALERWLGISREDTYTGGELIPVYAKYMQSKLLHPQEACALEELLLLHNHDDMAGMLELCSIFSILDALSFAPPLSVSQCERDKDFLYIKVHLKQYVPRQLQLEHFFPGTPDAPSLSPARLTLKEDTLCLALPIYEGSLKFFFEPIRDYYYFPLEDTAIHKSVAQFMDPSTRRKATASTCYTKKEGSFLPSLSQKPCGKEISLFYTGYRQKPFYYLLPDDLSSPDTLNFLGEYLTGELPAW